jgi:hypothetical protein
VTEERKAEIVKSHEDGQSHTSQAKKWDISQNTYSKIIRESRGETAARRKGGRKKAAAKAKPAPVAIPGMDLKGVLVAHLEYLRKETAKVERALEALGQ